MSKLTILCLLAFAIAVGVFLLAIMPMLTVIPIASGAGMALLTLTYVLSVRIGYLEEKGRKIAEEIEEEHIPKNEIASSYKLFEARANRVMTKEYHEIAKWIFIAALFWFGVLAVARFLE